MARAARTGAFALEAQPVLIGPADDAPAPEALGRRARAVLSAAVPVFADAQGGVSRLVGAEARVIHATAPRRADPLR